MDIVERLRTEQPSYVLIGDAAIEIERLRRIIAIDGNLLDEDAVHLRAAIDKRVADLETKYEWLENVVAEVNLHVDKLLEPSQIDKKYQPLWHPWTNSNEMTAPYGLIDVMLANGEIITEFSGRELNWLDNLDSEKKIVAWR
jgi:hypothetical protein